MLLRLTVIAVLLLQVFTTKAQDNGTVKDSLRSNTPADTDTLPEKEYEPVFKPTFGLGIGSFTFMGDVANGHKGFHSLVSRIGYELKVNHPLTSYLDLGFYVIFGKISANERDGLRNLNFESRIRTGGAILSYNFSHILPVKRNVEPYLFTGFESFEFLSKTDLFDKYGNRYHYWSDGSIRNLEENSFNSRNAIIIHRDYTYESDLREQNLDGFGKYRERSWAIPIGAGIQFLISERVKLKIGTSLHLTFTDMVDNVSAGSVGDRKGNSKNDKFLYSSFSLNYDLAGPVKHKKEKDKIKEMEDEGEGLLVLDLTDLDQDKVRDFEDHCLNTPAGVPVDEHGCPLDNDKDGVPDYMDDELPTPKKNIVNEKGVTLTDADFELMYLRHIDSTGQYHGGFQKVDREEVGGTGSLANSGKNTPPKQNLMYYVIVGSEKKKISANDLYKYLGQKDFRQIESGDTIFYVIGNYETVSEALAQQQKLEKEGIKTNGIGETNNKNGTNTTLNKQEIENKVNQENKGSNNNQNGNKKDEILYRVQIGAFDKKLSPKVFKDVPDVLSVTGPDNKTRYYSGTFSKLDKAAERKVDLLSKGFESAFIVAYKDGERITLQEAGAEMVDGTTTENTSSENETKVDPSRVKFKVQIGAFKNDIPAKVLDVFLQLGNVQLKRNDTGLTLYLVGSEDSFDAAEVLRKKVAGMGINDAFVIGEFNGSLIPAQEAIMLKGGK